MQTFRSVAVLVCAVSLSACGEKNAVTDITTPLTGAAIRFFNLGLNAPGVNFYANTTKLTAISSTTGAESTTGKVYGGVANAGLYSSIAPGQYTLTGKIAAATDKDLAVSTVSSTLDNGKFYSYYVSGLYNTTAKTVEAFVVEDPLPPAIDFNVAYVRFVNAISNSSSMTLYAKNTLTLTEAAIGGAVAYKGAGAFVSVPNGVYDVSTRLAGSSANAITLTAVSFVAGRVYTVSARGDMTIVSTTLANRPILQSNVNR